MGYNCLKNKIRLLRLGNEKNIMKIAEIGTWNFEQISHPYKISWSETLPWLQGRQLLYTKTTKFA